MSEKIIHVISVIDYIEENLHKKLDPERVSDAMHYSRYHLHRIFTETVGISIHDYIKRRKMTEAARLLVFSDRSVMDISFTAGYESQQAFTSAFKEMYKQTPARYRENENFYPLQLKYVLKENPENSSAGIIWEDRITCAAPQDIPIWLELVRLIVDGFPGLDEKEYTEQLTDSIRRKQAFILKDGNTAISIMILNRRTGSIDFFGVHPQYRKRGIAGAFLRKAESMICPCRSLSITTFRRGDKADPGYREAIRHLGFKEAGLMTEFGYPTQKMILDRTSREVSYESES